MFSGGSQNRSPAHRRYQSDLERGLLLHIRDLLLELVTIWTIIRAWA
jgi:hypothetical protein